MSKFASSFFKDATAKIDISYKIVSSSEVKTLNGNLIRPGIPQTFDKLNISLSIKEAKEDPINKDKPKEHQDGYIVNFVLQPLVDIELIHFEAKYVDITGLTNFKMLANGFQSWSQAREMTKDDKISSIRKSVAWYTQYNLQGDYDFFDHVGEKGHIHSSSYTHFRNINNDITYFGSLSEHLGYTYFKTDFNTEAFSIYKDVSGKRVSANESLPLVKVWTHHGINAEKSLWDTYETYIEDRRAIKSSSNNKVSPHVNGWTSWYNYYGDVSEAIINENVDALKKHNYPIDIFQIDDGFQTAIGDWLSINDKFPSGMKVVASKIKNAGFKAGLWLAPYAVGFTSTIVKDHPDWLIKDETGKPVVAGPNWGGFYAIDIYHPEAKNYLKKVFDTVLRDWGFDMVKLDFCFAAAMIPRNGKSRGQIMYEAMDLLRDLAGPDKLILGCGVPLAAAWKKVDYCRIGSDVAPWWEDNKLKLLHVRERVSTANSLVSTLSRWAMSDCMFGNDPNVMILRDNKNKLKHDERYTLCVLNNVLGALVFSSDNVGLYNKDEHLLYAATFPKVVPQVQSVLEFRPDVFMIKFTVPGDGVKTATRYYTTYANLSDNSQQLYLPPSKPNNTNVDNKGDPDTELFFATDNDMHTTRTDRHAHLFYHPSSAFKLKEHETKTFMHLAPPVGDKITFLGSTSHIIPGTEIDTFTHTPENGVQVTFRKENARKHLIYLGVGKYLRDNRDLPTKNNELKVNGIPVTWETIPVEGSGEGRLPSKVIVAVADL
ncbi:unnamed protein product [Cunninghamella blakesleeana]